MSKLHELANLLKVGKQQIVIEEELIPEPVELPDPKVKLNEFRELIKTGIKKRQPEPVVEPIPASIEIESVPDMPPEPIKTAPEAISEATKPNVAQTHKNAPESVSTTVLKQMQKEMGLLKKMIEESRSSTIKSFNHAMYSGSGGGEVEFRWLDDVDRNSIDDPGSSEHVLRYNPVTKKVFFGELTGDHREVNSFTFDVDGPNIPVTPRMISWNSDEDCLDIAHGDGSTLQTGLELYSRTQNKTVSTILPGTFVTLGVVDGTDLDALSITPFVANGTMDPIKTIGVATTPMTPNQFGRATKVGKVHELNTTGSSVGETWIAGDILWAHPTIPGKMTKVQPTAPNVVVFIGVVLISHATLGVISVRYTPIPRLYYGSFYDTTIQTNPVANVPHSMSFNTTAITNGVSISGSASPFNTYIKTENAGIYNIQFSAQVDKTDGGSDDIVIWLRKNGIDLTDTATTLTLPTNNSKVVAAWNWFVTSANGDYYQIIWRSADTDLRLLAEPISVDHPGIPSVIVTANRVDQFLSNTGSFSGSFTGAFTGSFSGSITAPGTTTQVVFNNGGVLGANSGFVDLS